MANLRNIKDRINSIKNTQKITRAMKMVAAAKVKKAEFTLSKEVDNAKWIPLENALEHMREGSIAWQLVKQVKGMVLCGEE